MSGFKRALCVGALLTFAAGQSEDACAGATTCGDCTAASYTNFWGEYIECAWCGDSCTELLQPTCAVPRTECTGEAGSVLTCRELGWTVAPGGNACGASKINNQCANLLTYPDAKAWCAQTGARLCTSKELENNVGMSTGCKLDRVRTWTADVCSQGHVTQAGASAFLSDTPASCDFSNSLAGVRCCADEPRGQLAAPPLNKVRTCEALEWRSAPGHVAVCANSLINGVCIHDATFATAQASCFAVGARLCTITELEANEAAGSGCRLDQMTVWSSTPCGDGLPGGAMVGTGAASDVPSTCNRLGARHGVRCCADHAVAPTTLSCEQLRWKVNFGGKCARSKLNRECSGAVSSSGAAEFCGKAGARVCGADELKAGLAQSTGCALDGARVWSGTSCPGGFLSMVGTSGEVCTPAAAMLPVRCCADAQDSR